VLSDHPPADDLPVSAARRRTWAVVPARAGSKGLPGKNVAPLAGRPLVEHAIAQGARVAGIDEVVVTTDDPQVAAVAHRLGVRVVDRPEELAGDLARSVDAVVHALDAVEAADDDLVVLLQPTSPLRSDADVAGCLARADGAGAVVTVCEADHHPFKGFVEVDGALVPVRELDDLEAPRQALPRALRPNGAVYVVGVGQLRREGRFLVAPVDVVEVPLERSLDVDTAADLARAEDALAAVDPTG
jgi:N-acylneuraminate cytidylyltransferase